MALYTWASDFPRGVLVCLLVGLLAGYLGGLVAYRIWWHPLAKFPGPKLAAASKLYETYYDLFDGPGGQFPAKVRALHQQYGPIVRITPEELAVDDVDFHIKLYAPQPAVRDKWAPITQILGTTEGTFSTVEHHLHRKRRVAASSFFSLANIAAAEPVLHKHIERCCALLWSQKDKPVELRVPFAALMFDSMYDMAFNDQLNSLTDLDIANQWDLTTDAISTFAPWLKSFPWSIKPFLLLPMNMVKKLSHKVARILQVSHRIRARTLRYLDETEKSEYKGSIRPAIVGRPETLFEVLQRRKLHDTEDELERLTQEGTELFAAAATPVRVLTAVMFYLLDRPETLAKLREELDAAYPDRMTIPTLKSMESLPYLINVVKEALRVAFPVGGRLPLLCREPMTFGNWIIPPGTPLSVNHRNLMLDPAVFPEPTLFKPERWFDNDLLAIEDRHYIPWGRGGRSCLGKDYAQGQMQMVLATLCRRYEFELVDTTYERDVKISREPFLAHASLDSRGVKIRITGLRG
ncbi:cytochrome P450 [Pseudovirgaria hyperparasitica]|uniref:Cytochrome P450 n=1 Tax=Pseudovirgaria hyperparasitica TaxID=470096 RepID=A0A6A6W0K9_9PEZI|nr:cytochrome P450 [Pseudovirgaria hyperparasitica]KAF2756045.1 cytochrome P450 [Pseudovirgaria hyperparasitica]